MLTNSGSSVVSDAQARPPRSLPHPGIVVVGSVVLDRRVLALVGQQVVGKCLAQFRVDFGGASRNVSRAILDYGGAPRPFFQVGRDRDSDEAIGVLGDEFAAAHFDRCYVQLRESVILPNGQTFTSRPSLQQDYVPEPLRARLSTAAWAVVAPYTPDDFAFVEDVLRVAPKSLLMLSRQQAQDPSRARRLMLGAEVTVMNHEEAEALTGCSDPSAVVRQLADQGCPGLVVTTPAGAEAFLGGELLSIPAVVAGQPQHTSGAGDHCVGVMVHAWSTGLGWRDRLELGQAAAARHVTGLSPLPGLDALQDWATRQPRVPAPARVSQPRSSFHPARAIGAGVGLGLAASLLLSLMG